MKRIAPLVVDAFSGAGGLALGLARAGLAPSYSFDIDKDCIATIKANPKYLDHRADVAAMESMVNGGLLRELQVQPGDIDVLAGGPPCQGFSVQRIGSDDDVRNKLVPMYADLVLEVRPRVVLLENVPGLGGKRGTLELARLRQSLDEAGYLTDSRILDAQDYGVAQRRRRLFLVGVDRTAQGLSEFLWPSTLTQVRTVRDVIGNLPAPPEDGTEHAEIANHRADRLSELNRSRLKYLKPGQSRVDLPPELLVNAHRRSADVIGHRNVYGRMDWDTVAPTITARFDSFTRGKFGHPEQVRSISLREGALLQDFPADYVFTGTKVSIARQIGNAVPLGLGYAIGKSISRTLELSKKDGSEAGIA